MYMFKYETSNLYFMLFADTHMSSRRERTKYKGNDTNYVAYRDIEIHKRRSKTKRMQDKGGKNGVVH